MSRCARVAVLASLVAAPLLALAPSASACSAGIRPSYPPQVYTDLDDCVPDCEAGIRPSLPPQPYAYCR